MSHRCRTRRLVWASSTGTMILVAAFAHSSPVLAQPSEPFVTLRDTLLQARVQSPARLAAAARVDAADSSRAWAGRPLNPTTEFRWENIAPGLRSALSADIFATLTQPIELGGKRGARRGVALATADGARATMGFVERMLDIEIAQRFLAVVRERDRRRTLTEQAEGLAEIVRILERRVAEGVTAEADLRKIETERTRVETDAVLATIAATRELTALGALAGWTRPPPPEALERPVVELPAGAEADATLLGAVDRRPDVRIAASRLEAARQHLRFEEARAVPDLHVTGGFKRTAGYDTGLVAVLLPVPLFERNRASIALADGNVRAAALELDQTRRIAVGEARAAREAAIELTRRATDAATRLTQPAAVVRAAARAAFTTGAGDLLRLVDAERVWAETRLTVDALAIEALRATIEARLALAEEAVP